MRNVTVNVHCWRFTVFWNVFVVWRTAFIIDCVYTWNGCVLVALGNVTRTKKTTTKKHKQWWLVNSRGRSYWHTIYYNSCFLRHFRYIFCKKHSLGKINAFIGACTRKRDEWHFQGVKLIFNVNRTNLQIIFSVLSMRLVIPLRIFLLIWSATQTGVSGRARVSGVSPSLLIVSISAPLERNKLKWKHTKVTIVSF